MEAEGLGDRVPGFREQCPDPAAQTVGSCPFLLSSLRELGLGGIGHHSLDILAPHLQQLDPPWILATPPSLCLLEVSRSVDQTRVAWLGLLSENLPGGELHGEGCVTVGTGF